MKVSAGHFLLYQRRFIGLYLFVMTFITIMLYVEPTMSVHFKNIVYIHIITFSTLALYLAIEFMYVKTRFSQIEDHWQDGVFIQEGLAEPKTYEQYLYRQFFQTINESHQEKMQSILQDKKETLEFMTTWFHEIKTPIAVSKLIIDKSAKTPELQSIYEEITNIDHLIERALYFVRTDNFNQDYFILQTELDKILRSVIKQHAKAFIRKKIKLDFQVEAFEILTDRKWLEFLISQIISNSLKYIKDGGTIVVQSEEDLKEVRLIVTDNGIGISQADLPRVFENGFTGANGRSYGNSTGMGLYLANKLARKLGHELSIVSNENEYTSLTIHFPKGLDYYSVLKLN